MPIGPPLQVGSIPDDPSALTDPESTQPVPTASVFDDPGPASPMPAMPAAPAAPAEPRGEDLERWFWTESEALADLGPKARFRSLRRLFRSK